MSVPSVSDGEFYFFRKTSEDDTSGPSQTAKIVTIGGALYARIPHDRGNNDLAVPITQLMFTQQGGTVWKGPTTEANCDNYGSTYDDSDVDALPDLALPDLNAAGAGGGVSTFEGRGGDVVGQLGDYAASEIQQSGLNPTATVQDAIDDLETRLQVEEAEVPGGGGELPVGSVGIFTGSAPSYGTWSMDPTFNMWMAPPEGQWMKRTG